MFCFGSTIGAWCIQQSNAMPQYSAPVKTEPFQGMVNKNNQQQGCSLKTVLGVAHKILKF